MQRWIFCALIGLAASCGDANDPADLDPADLDPAVLERGIISYYADSLAGQLMANGEPYDPTQPICAHRTLAFGTEIEVERLSNGIRARCTVKDRGPFVDGRIVDVSRYIAETLDMIEAGIVEGQIYDVTGR